MKQSAAISEGGLEIPSRDLRLMKFVEEKVVAKSGEKR